MSKFSYKLCQNLTKMSWFSLKTRTLNINDTNGRNRHKDANKSCEL